MIINQCFIFNYYGTLIDCFKNEHLLQKMCPIKRVGDTCSQ